MVKHDGLVDKLVVTADGTGQVGHAGSALLAGTADRVGLTGALSEAMAPTRERRSQHDPGVVLRDLVVTLADGGECLSDIGALRDQPDLFGGVASDSTAFRAIDSVDERCLARLAEAVASARARAWGLGARPERTVLDVDATLTAAQSDKEHAKGNFKGGYGHHPLLCYLDGSGEGLSGVLRAGNAGSNTASDHTRVLDAALGQLDRKALAGELLVRADGTERERSQVCEITDRLDLSGWPERSRLIARRTLLKEGDQQSFADHDGHRLAVFLSDQPGEHIPTLDLDHRGHARVEDRIREGKDCGLGNLPFRSFAHNQVWLFLVLLAQDLIAWTKALCLKDEAAAWELKRLRYRYADLAVMPTLI